MTLKSTICKLNTFCLLAFLAFMPAAVWGDLAYKPRPIHEPLLPIQRGCSDLEFCAGLVLIVALFLAAFPYRASRRIRLPLICEATLILFLVTVEHFHPNWWYLIFLILFIMGTIEITHILVSFVYQIVKKSLPQNWKQDVCRILLLVAIALSIWEGVIWLGSEVRVVVEY